MPSRIFSTAMHPRRDDLRITSPAGDRAAGAARPRVLRIPRALTVVLLTFAAASAVSDPALASSSPVWAIQPTPNTGGWVRSLFGVSCTTATACTAVGRSGGATLAERWKGTAWAIQTTPNPTGAMYSALSGVSCTAANACTAVGYSGGATLAERWNGTAWSIQPTPNAGVASFLYGVSCTTGTACTAVGYSKYIGCSIFHCIFYAALAEGWNGATWTIQSGLPAYRAQLALTGVSCTGPSACTGAGSWDYNASTFAAGWNGTTWATQPTPNPTGATTSDLSAVSCTTANACTAVGQGNGTLAERWNGTAWSIQPSPNPTGGLQSLSGVSCTAAAACTAVGDYANSSGTPMTLAEQWNGTAWAIHPTPNPSGATRSVLYGVSCTAAAACTAVGGSVSASGTNVSLAERYSG
jgi:hypothetical protein